jgi:hypothetical protein
MPVDGSVLVLPPWLSEASVFVSGHNVVNTDCRTGICEHNENTDLVRWNGVIYLVHRTALSQVLGPDSSLNIYRSMDNGQTFTLTARIPAPDYKLTPIDGPDQATMGRDIRDPHFYIVGNTLHIKALARMPVTSARDTGVQTLAVSISTTDGVNWTPYQVIGPTGYSFWRIKQSGGVYYSAAYTDGDQSVYLFSSTDGLTWTMGPLIYGVSADTPLETEITFMPSGKMLALIRMDGSDADLFGNVGPLRTKVCWSSPPFSSFDCSAEFMGERLDGPLDFQWQGRLFVIARRHLQPTYKKRTSLFEITGNFDGGPVSISYVGDLPSAGDTSYAGAVALDDHNMLLSWYSGDIHDDVDWLVGMLGLSDIWLGTLDLSKVPMPMPTSPLPDADVLSN